LAPSGAIARPSIPPVYHAGSLTAAFTAVAANRCSQGQAHHVASRGQQRHRQGYWSTIGPSNITGTGIGNMTAHLGAPRTMLASVTVDF